MFDINGIKGCYIYFGIFMVVILVLSSCKNDEEENELHKVYELLDEMCLMEVDCIENADINNCIDDWSEIVDVAKNNNCLNTIRDFFSCVNEYYKCDEGKYIGRENCSEINEKAEECAI